MESGEAGFVGVPPVAFELETEAVARRIFGWRDFLGGKGQGEEKEEAADLYGSLQDCAPSSNRRMAFSGTLRSGALSRPISLSST